MTSKNLSEKVKTLQDIQNVLGEDNTLRDILPNYTMAARFLLVLPATSCTAESFLRRQNLVEKQHGSTSFDVVGTVSINKEIVDLIDMIKVVNGFIQAAKVRENLFLLLEESNT